MVNLKEHFCLLYENKVLIAWYIEQKPDHVMRDFVSMLQLLVPKPMECDLLLEAQSSFTVGNGVSQK